MLTLYDYAGVIHFHSEYSHDGRVSVSEIVRAAHGSEIDFLMLTDHSCLNAKTEGREGWNGDVLLMVGQEIAPRFNHYIAFGTNTPIVVGEEDRIHPQDYIDRINNEGGIGFICHPDHEGTEMFHVKHFPWVEWNVSGYSGMGIWDFMTDWQSSLTSYPRAILSYLCPALFLRGPRQVTLARWDTLNGLSRVVGIGELDNHDTPKRFCGLNLSVFPFARAFRFIRTHIVTDAPLRKNSQEDIEILLTALSRGRAYVALEYFRKARGFSFLLSDGEGTATMGDEFLLKGQATVHVAIPEKGKISLIKNGATMRQVTGRILEAPITENGNYRVEVYLKKCGRYRPWIFSNPIYVR